VRRLVVLAIVGCHAPASPRDPAPAPVELRDALAETSLLADIAWLTAPERAGRGSQTPSARATAEWLANELRAAGYRDVIEQAIPELPGQVNVIASTPGSGRAVVVMAHYDHLGVQGGALYPGANDNASGVAVALAVARDLAAHHVTGRVAFVFTGGEEVDLLGARAFVASPPPPLPLAAIRVVYNLDMVGTPLFGNDAQLAAVGLPDDPDLADVAATAARTAGLTLISVRPGLLTLVGEDRRSDDWVVRDAHVPAVHFSTGLSEDYHRPSDTADRLSRPQLVRIAHFLRALVEATAHFAAMSPS
jgi:Zn-dependent M28 family amino/carboxypeptidase